MHTPDVEAKAQRGSLAPSHTARKESQDSDPALPMGSVAVDQRASLALVSGCPSSCPSSPRAFTVCWLLTPAHGLPQAGAPFHLADSHLFSGPGSVTTSSRKPPQITPEVQARCLSGWSPGKCGSLSPHYKWGFTCPSPPPIKPLLTKRLMNE